MKRLALLASIIISLPTHADLSANYTSDIATVVDGGIKKGAVYLDMLEITTGKQTEDTEWAGTLLVTNSQTFSDQYAGDSQVASNIDNGQMIRLYELWYLQSFDQHQWQVGLIDLNGLYDAIDTASLFLNSSHGIGPDFSQSGANGPSIFPVTSLAINWAWQINEQWHWQTGLFDAVPGDPNHPTRNTIKISKQEGALITSELGFDNIDLQTTIGTWYYTQPTTAESSMKDHNSGHYLSVEKPNEEGLAWWVRVGQAKPSVNDFRRYTGGGATYPLWDGLAGIGVARAEYTQAVGGGAEITWEMTYAKSINDVVSLQPSIQFIQQPSYSGISDTTVVILRVNIDLAAWLEN